MSNERFDKLIKKQLESVQPPYKEEAWKNFKRLLPVPWYVALLRKYGGWAYVSLATITVLTTTYLYTQERTENKQLHEEIITLNSKINTQDSIYNKPGSRQELNQPDQENNALSAAQTAVRKDTVYIFKEVYRDRPVTSSNKNNNIDTNKPALRELPEITSEPRQTRPASVKSENNQANRIGANTANKSVTNTVNNVGANKGNPATAKPSLNNGTSVSAPGNVAGQNNANSNNQALTGKEDPPKNPSDTVSNRNVASFSSSKDSSKVVNTPTDIASVPVKQAASNAPNKNTFKLGPLRAQLGVSFDFLGLKRTSVGPAAEVFLLPNLSLNAGLLVLSPEEERHEDPREFNRMRGKRFEDIYRNKLPPNEKIERIKFNTTVIKLPLSLSYYMPVKNNWSVIASGGTLLDLSVYRSVDFESTFQGKKELVILDDRPKPATFNNLKFGVGVQYQYGRFVGQLSPYYYYRFRTPDYGRPNPKIGVNTTIKFNLRK